MGNLPHNAGMPRLQRRSFTSPDEVRTFTLGRIDVIHLDETAISRFVFEPGWRWSKDVAPLVGTDQCQNRHVGFVISGSPHVLMEDGTELEILPGDAYEIPPGHDAWVVGDDHWDTVEFTSARSFAIPPDAADERTLATVLFTDIVDSTATIARVGDATWHWRDRGRRRTGPRSGGPCRSTHRGACRGRGRARLGHDPRPA